MTSPVNEDARISRAKFNIGPYEKFIKKSFCLELIDRLEPSGSYVSPFYYNIERP